jgi:hypothetical protein
MLILVLGLWWRLDEGAVLFGGSTTAFVVMPMPGRSSKAESGAAGELSHARQHTK